MMPTIQLTMQSTADWFTVDLPGGAAWSLPFHVDHGGSQINNAEISGQRLIVGRVPVSGGTTSVTLSVTTDAQEITVTIGHGDNGTVRVSSPAATVVNDQRVGDGQNRLPFDLLLRR